MDALLRLTHEKTATLKAELHEQNKRHLAKLGITDRVNSTFIDMSRRGIDKRESVHMADPIFNLSSRKLDDIETRLLSKSLRYGVKAKQVNAFEILARFEEFAQLFANSP